MHIKSLIHNSAPDTAIFVTIDDVTRQAQALWNNLQILSGYKHPFEVRKGCGKEVNAMTDERNEPSRMLKAGKKTYFFDVKATKDGKPYLMITETWFKDDQQKEPDRNNIIIFPEQAKDFALAIVSMLDQIVPN
jgi:hypothetical protein